MSQEIQKSTSQALSEMMRKESVAKNFEQMLGKKSAGFITSVLAVTSGNQQLRQCDPKSIYKAAMIAASLDLPVDPNLGFAALVPFKGECQFQIQYGGLRQLAYRTGKYDKIEAKAIYEGQIEKLDNLTGDPIFNFEGKKSDTVIGYMAYSERYNMDGRRVVVSLYMDKDSIDAHGKKYSQTYKKGFGLWKDNFDAMAKKTVLKFFIKNHCSLSIEDAMLQRAIALDQSVVKGEINSIEDIDSVEVQYVDNTPETMGDKAQAFLDREKSSVEDAEYAEVDSTPEKALIVEQGKLM